MEPQPILAMCENIFCKAVRVRKAHEASQVALVPLTRARQGTEQVLEQMGPASLF